MTDKPTTEELAQDLDTIRDPMMREAATRLRELEAENARLKGLNRDLNRRWQKADSAARENQKSAGGSFGRSLANYAYTEAIRERDTLHAENARLRAQRREGILKGWHACFAYLEPEVGPAFGVHRNPNDAADAIERELD